LFSIEVFFEKGYVVLNGLNTSSKTYGKETLTIAKNRTLPPLAKWDEEEKIHFKIDNSWEREIIEFNKSISKNKRPTIGNSLEALHLMKMVDSIYKFKRV